MRGGIQALRDLLTNHPTELIAPLAVFAVTLAVGYLVRRVFLRALQAWNKRTQSRSGRMLIEALRGPMAIWILILAVHFAIESSELPARFTRWSPRVLAVLGILSLTLMCMRLAGDLVRYYGSQTPGALPVTTLTQTLAQLAVVILGTLVILNQMGFSITPILTALGVGGLAVALALQDTLSNLFAGFYVAVAGQVRLGDYIKMENGPEGYVTDISWRSTTIRALSNNFVIVPNSKLAQAIVTNYHLPEKRLASQVQVGVSYDADPSHVERVLMEIGAAGAREIPGMLAEPEPSVALDPGFGESSLGFTLNYSVAEFVNQFGVRNELRKRILLRFREEGIGMPYPTRTILLEQRSAHD
ncbi:MAG: mechanosensitive ion channel family protein [Terriglobia bacterium]|nr:MAG: mechanosensitive ion channel family protein [Terriglobia bacterium]